VHEFHGRLLAPLLVGCVLDSSSVSQRCLAVAAFAAAARAGLSAMNRMPGIMVIRDCGYQHDSGAMFRDLGTALAAAANGQRVCSISGEVYTVAQSDFALYLMIRLNLRVSRYDQNAAQLAADLALSVCAQLQTAGDHLTALASLSLRCWPIRVHRELPVLYAVRTEEVPGRWPHSVTWVSGFEPHGVCAGKRRKLIVFRGVSGAGDQEHSLTAGLRA